VAGASQGGSDGTTSDGTPGDWDITLNFSGFTGQMGLNIEASGTGIACPPAVPYC
jgi:hypothetical protein